MNALKERWLDPWARLYESHRELSGVWFDAAGSPREREEARLREHYLDVLRFSDFILEDRAAGPAPASRARAKETTPGASSASALELWLDASLRFERSSRLVRFKAALGEPAPQASALRGVVTEPAAAPCFVLAATATRSDYEKTAGTIFSGKLPGVRLVLQPAAWTLLLAWRKNLP